jgi:putative transposase
VAVSGGDGKEAIFLDDVDRQDFLKTLAQPCQKAGFAVHAYCLMKNHFHLVVEMFCVFLICLSPCDG